MTFSRYAGDMRWLLILVMIVMPFAGQSASGAKRILVEGHRGARWAMPENTLPAFHHAIEVGADVLEMDTVVTKDNVLVVSHDAEMRPEICKGPEELPRVIRELTLAQVKQFDCGWAQNPGFPTQKAVPGTRMPTLEEVFRELAPLGKFEFNIETKIHPAKPALAPAPEEFARLLVAEIRKFKLESRVIVQSFDFRTLHAVKMLAPEIRRSALIGTGEASFLSVSKRAGDAPIVSPQLQLVTAEKVREAHAAGLKVVPWTANQPAELQALIDADVDSIITDNPEGLIRYLAERNLH